MSYQFYLALHFLGIILFFASFGGMAVSALLPQKNEKLKKQLAMTHGLGLLIMLIAGFGLLVKTGYGFPGWVIVKIIIWVIFGASVVILKRSSLNNIAWNLMLLLGFAAVYLAVFKPF